jgi:hypothetical protein
MGPIAKPVVLGHSDEDVTGSVREILSRRQGGCQCAEDRVAKGGRWSRGAGAPGRSRQHRSARPPESADGGGYRDRRLPGRSVARSATRCRRPRRWPACSRSGRRSSPAMPGQPIGRFAQSRASRFPQAGGRGPRRRNRRPERTGGAVREDLGSRGRPATAFRGRRVAGGAGAGGRGGAGPATHHARVSARRFARDRPATGPRQRRARACACPGDASHRRSPATAVDRRPGGPAAYRSRVQAPIPTGTDVQSPEDAGPVITF